MEKTLEVANLTSRFQSDIHPYSEQYTAEFLDLPYLRVLRDVLAFGTRVENRTGVDTICMPGMMARYDLRHRFPLLTTKRVHFAGIITELCWLLQGRTNVKWLQERGVTIWNEWADPETGELGPIYGHGWRRFGAQPEAIKQPTPKLREGVEATYLGVANGEGKTGHILGKIWEGMIARCYDPKASSYSGYGERGVFVCNAWLEFRQFAQDCETLPGWDKKVQDLRGYVLDKDTRGNGFCYSPETCCWITPQENGFAKADSIFTVIKEETGEEFSFSNPAEFCREQGIPDGNFSDLWTGRKNAVSRNGFRFVSKKLKNPGFDQLVTAFLRLRANPNDRQVVVSAWDPAAISLMALPPCHVMFQFRIIGGRLYCMMFQRSCDLFLGVPYNIASYAALTVLFAKILGVKPGFLIHFMGDAHIYVNHLEQVREQLEREPRPSPTLNVWPAGWLENFESRMSAEAFFDNADPTWFELQGYDPHPAIKAPVAV